ncbi:MAG: RMD1 family protein [Kiritimatiellae bacterium]|nr:RMD1 family protein [Kiritimatiellia bacterium]
MSEALQSDAAFAGLTRFQARAVFLGKRLDLHALPSSGVMGESPLVVAIRDEAFAVLFRYGVVVLINTPPVQEAAFLKELAPFVRDPVETPRIEEAGITVEPEAKEGMHGGRIELAHVDVPRLQLIATVLARSAVLDDYEQSIRESFDEIEPLGATLAGRGRDVRRPQRLLRQIGKALMSLATMVGRVEVHEKPGVLWEHPELDLLYSRLAAEYEIAERHRALEQKLELVSRTAETALSLLQARRTLRVEWYIVILIVVEIFLTLYELFLH